MAARLYGVDASDTAKIQAAAKINAALTTIQALYAECEEVAIAHGVSFSYSGPAGYGDSGGFDPESAGEEDEWGDEQSGWRPSSQSC